MSNPFTEPVETQQNFSNGAPPLPPRQPRLLFPPDDDTSVVMQPASVTAIPTRRAPGRPRTKVQPADVRPSTEGGIRFGGVPGAPPPGQPGSKATPKSLEDEARRKQERKEKDIKDLQGKIVKDFNEQLMEGLITLGIPEAFLYKNPSARPMAVDSKYTNIGQAICINPMQANWMAHGITEAKEFPFVQKITLGKSEGPSYFWLALGGLGILSYLQGLVTAVAQLRKLTNELKSIQDAMSPEDLREPGMQFQEGAPL